MSDTTTPPDPHDSPDPFTAWLERPPARTRVRARHRQPADAGTRFVFYGRISTRGYQDEASSRLWQYDKAARVITGHGQVVAEYFDVGYSRSLLRKQRPKAAALLRAAAEPVRVFDAVVFGEYERVILSAGTGAVSKGVSEPVVDGSA